MQQQHEVRGKGRRGQTMVEFALTLPIVLLLTFGVIEFGRLFQAWVTLQNSARTAVRYGVTGNWDVDSVAKHTERTPNPGILDEWVPCTEGTDVLFQSHWGFDCEPSDLDHQGLRNDLARLPSIVEEARRGAAGLNLNDGDNIVGLERAPGQDMNSEPPGAETEPGWFHVYVCSGRAEISNAEERRYRMTEDDKDNRLCHLNADAEYPNPPPGTNQYDAGGPGELIEVIVWYNAPLITPLSSMLGWTGLDGYVQMRARRVGVNESFRNTRAVNLPPVLDLPTFTPSNTPDPNEPSPFPSNTPFPTAELPTATSTDLPPTETPNCVNLSVVDYELFGASLRIRVRNDNPASVFITGAVVGWAQPITGAMYPDRARIVSGGRESHWRYDGDLDFTPPTNIGVQGSDGNWLEVPTFNREFFGGGTLTWWSVSFQNGPSNLADPDSGLTINDFHETRLYFEDGGRCELDPGIPPPENTPVPSDTPAPECDQFTLRFERFEAGGVVTFSLFNGNSTAHRLTGFGFNWRDTPPYNPGNYVAEVRVGPSSFPSLPNMWQGNDSTSPTEANEAGGGDPAWQFTPILNGSQTSLIYLNFNGIGTNNPLDTIGAEPWNFNGSFAQVEDCTVLIEDLATPITPSPTPPPGTITLVKQADVDDGYEFEFDAIGSEMWGVNRFFLQNGDSRTFTEFAPGTYSVREILPEFWELTDITCNDPDDETTYDLANDRVDIDLDSGENITCTFTNTQIPDLLPGSITIIKDADDNDPEGQGATEFFFETSGNPLDDDFSLFDDEQITWENVPVGSYDVWERLDLLEDYWYLAEIDCTDPDNGTTVNIGTDRGTATINVDSQEDITCIFRNRIDEDLLPTETPTPIPPGSITIVKDADVDDGFEFEFDIFGNSVDLQDGESVTYTDLAPGGYTVTEILPEFWELTNISCNDPDGGTSIDLGNNRANIDLDSEEDITCTFTNEQIPELVPGSITIRKVVDGDDPAGAGATEFQFNSSGNGSFTLNEGEERTFDNLDVGSYDIWEELSGLDPWWSLDSISCNDPSGGTTTNIGSNRGTASIDVEGGENVTCTFTNSVDEEELPTFTIIKEADVDDGTQFSFDVAGDNVQLRTGESHTVSAVPGSYTVSENVPDGWELENISCSGDSGTTFNLPDARADIDLDEGEDITCTFTNSLLPLPSSITIVKEADDNDPDGQGSTAFRFRSADGADFTLNDGDSNAFTNLAAGSYEIWEVLGDLDPWWSLDSISCDDPSGGTTTSITANRGTAFIDLAEGEDVTCTFNNVVDEEVLPSITLVKNTDVDDGTEFSFDAFGNNISLQNGESQVFSNLTPGIYNIRESVPSGWALEDITCVDPDNGTTYDLDSQSVDVDLDVGEDITCTFDNIVEETEASSITVVKTTIPNGAVGTFQFDAFGNALTLDAGQSFTYNDLTPGTYTISETVPNGWDLTSINCNDPDSGTTYTTTDAVVDLDEGENITCTFVNTQTEPPDIPGFD